MWGWVEDLWRDLHYCIRTLGRSPGFLAVSVLSLSLGIGANTAIFTLINAVMLRSLPIFERERLVQLTRLAPTGKPEAVSYPLFKYYHDNLKSLSGSAVEMSSNPVIIMNGTEESVTADLVSGDHYSVLRIEPADGRLIQPADDVASPGSPVAVISYRYWQRRFGLAHAAIGKTLTLQNKTFTIIGITPPYYHGTRPGRDPDITVPIFMMLNDRERRDSTLNMLTMTGRLGPGVSIEQANAEGQVLWEGFVRWLNTTPSGRNHNILNQRVAVVGAATGFTSLRSDYSEALLVLMGMVVLVLLLGCANLSGMLLARAAAREREISIRLALGAGGSRLIRQFFAESFVLAALGAGAGLLLAHWLSQTLVTMMANGGTLFLPTAPDWRVLAFTIIIALLVCVLTGLAPGVHALKTSLTSGLKGMRATGQQRFGKVLVISQLAISLVLLLGATVFAGTLVKLYSVDRGLQTDGILTFTIRTSDHYSQARAWAIQTELLDQLNALPTITSASAAGVIPMSGVLWARPVQVEGYSLPADDNMHVGFNAVAPRFFETIGTPLLSGRDFDARDTNFTTKVAIVNESFARFFFGMQSPLGKRVTTASVTYEIVGVVKDAKYQDLRQNIIKTLYVSWMQREGEQPSSYSFFLRVKAGDPTSLAPVVEKLLRATDSGLRLRNQEMYSTVVARSMVKERILATLGGFFGLVALIVACLGIFGLIAFQVSRRINEIGLRMALGASRGGIVILILRDVAAMLLAGSLIGAVIALSLSSLTQKMLFEITPTQPGVLALAILILGLAVFSAAWLPARRAARTDPMIALRHD